MKMQIAAICFNERELELYVGQLKEKGFETLSEVKKADDGSFYQAMAKASKYEAPLVERVAVSAPAPLPA